MDDGEKSGAALTEEEGSVGVSRPGGFDLRRKALQLVEDVRVVFP